METTAINYLYKTLAHDRIGDDFAVCRRYVRPEDFVGLAAMPLRELTYDDRERYSRKAISTSGDAKDGTRHRDSLEGLRSW